MLVKRLLIIMMAFGLAFPIYAGHRIERSLNRRTSVAAAQVKTIPTGRININKANAKDLITVKGIGEKKAQAIVAYRNQHGSFHSVDDLTAIRGIGEKRLEKMKPFLTI